MARILITAVSFGKTSKEPFRILEEAGIDYDINRKGKPFTEEELINIIADYDGVIVGLDPVTEKVIEKGRKLKIVAKHGVGTDNIDLYAATKRKIYVTITSGANEQAVADLAFALMLALARKVNVAHMMTIKGEWPRLIGTEIWGKKLGVVGMGRIGRNVIIRATGFNMQIYGYDPCVDEEFCKKYRVKVTDLPTLFKESDIITLHAPLTEQTRHMVNRERLSLMKESAFLINTARGELIDEEALFEALKEKKIAGAALDCFSKEPPGRDLPLFKLENVLFTPHIGAYTVEANRNMGIMAAKSVVDVLRGDVPQNIANREILNYKITR